MKKALFIYPHNFLERNMGTNNRVYEIAKFLKSRDFIVDLYACENFVSTTYGEFDQYNRENIINELYLYDFQITHSYSKLSKMKGFFKWLRNAPVANELDNWVTPQMQKQFDQIMNNGYDYVVMFYAYTAELLKELNSGVKKVYFMEDLLSVGHYISGISNEIGGPLNSEIKRLEYFDDIICISYDEKTFFEKLMRNQNLHFLPHLIEEKPQVNSPDSKDIDLLFIGYNNIYNIEGIRWFFDNVYPKLHKKIKIAIAGKVTEHIHESYANVECIPYVKDLNEIYNRARIAICPLLNGTGMKIKVIEAMSYGLPVVCTNRGVDGFPDKRRNGCLVSDQPEQFADYVNQLCEDREFYSKVSDDISQYFRQHLSKEINMAVLQNVFNERARNF